MRSRSIIEEKWDARDRALTWAIHKGFRR